jgi:hypothetical protein
MVSNSVLGESLISSSQKTYPSLQKSMTGSDSRSAAKPAFILWPVLGEIACDKVAKPTENMVAREGVEPPAQPFQFVVNEHLQRLNRSWMAA